MKSAINKGSDKKSKGKKEGGDSNKMPKISPASSAGDTPQKNFMQIFREAGPYIHSLKDKIVVIGISRTLAASAYLPAIARDITLLNSLGLRLVVVFEAREEMAKKGESGTADVVDDSEMETLKAFIGKTRINLTAYLNIGYADLPSHAHRDIHVVSANYIAARSQGVIHGVDSARRGVVRKIKSDLLREHLATGAVVLLDPLGYSVSGASYYIPMSEVAGAVAVALGAEKLIFVTEAPGVVDEQGAILRNLTLNEAREIMEKVSQDAEITRVFPALAEALSSHRVKRGQLVSGIIDGSLPAELFTREGVGTSLSSSSFQNMRPATSRDIATILEIVRPLTRAGTLIARGSRYFETFIKRFWVLEFDEIIYGCAELKTYTGDACELACLAILPEVQDQGYGEDILAKIEEEARGAGKKKLFALTTGAADWFRARGFRETAAAALPEERRLEYEANKRQSKVFVKML